MRWVGIDEAGYGPNLGPLVMTAVIAESRVPHNGPSADQKPSMPDLWRDLEATVVRGGVQGERLWVDDSKVVLRNRRGRDRLEATCLALLDAAGCELPRNRAELHETVGAGSFDDVELRRWHDDSRSSDAWPATALLERLEIQLRCKPLEPPDAPWRITRVRSVVLGPERFNNRLVRLGSKASVQFTAFRELLCDVWELAADGRPTDVQSDKHGGRHYYFEPLVASFPGTWIERGVEGPALSRYTVRGSGRCMSLSLAPRADGQNGLVALASIVSKTLREVWMDVFNAYWTGRVQGLSPTAGYPVDAARFRLSIEPIAQAAGLHLDLWWRRK
jgi:hypothetical protein